MTKREAIAFGLVMALCLGLFLGMSAPREPGYVEAPAVLWQRGPIPIGATVVAVYVYGGEVVTIPAIMSDFAGLYEYSKVGRIVKPLPEPLYWAWLPEEVSK